MQRTENLRVQLTRRLIQEGLLRCLKRQRISSLSISELCREAGVNRATFYHHYETPLDVLKEIGWNYAAELQEIARKYGMPSTETELQQRIVQCSTFLFEQKTQLKILFSENADQALADTAQDIIRRILEKNARLHKEIVLDEEEYRLVVTASGWSAYALIRQWLMEDIQKSPEEIGRLFQKLINNRLLLLSTEFVME